MEYKSTLLGHFSFEIKSFLWRKLINPKANYSTTNRYLNLGCGPNYIEGYLNADFFPRFNFFTKNKIYADWYLDLRYPLNCKSNFLKGIYSEHTIEHLYPSDVKKLLFELYRILEPGGIIRITVPDLEKYVNYYNGNLKPEFSDILDKKYTSTCSAIRNLTQNYHHLSLWDFNELKNLLLSSGFVNVEKKDFLITQDPMLCLDLGSRRYETLYVEAKKPYLND